MVFKILIERQQVPKFLSNLFQLNGNNSHTQNELDRFGMLSEHTKSDIL